MNKWLNTKEAAAFLKVSRSTVHRYCRRGMLPYYKKKYGLRFKAADLEEWLEQGARNVLTFLVPVDIEMLKGGNSELARKKPTCLKYGRVYLRTYRSGRSSQTIDYRDENGKRVQLAVEGTREDAILALQKKLIEVFKRKQGFARGKRKIRFRAFAKIYIQDYAMITKRSWRTDASRLRIMVEFFKDTELREITPLIIQKYRAWILGRGCRRSTANRHLALLKRMLSIAVEEGFIEGNPAAKVKLFSEKDNLKERILAKDEEARLMGTCSDALRPILVVALNTGMRKGEILGLEWNQVDFKRRKIRVEKTKSGRVRYIPVNEVLLYELRRVKTKNSHVFFNPETQKPYVDMKKGFKGACRRAEIKGLRFHDLRHTFATRLAEMGVHIKDIRDLLGHSSIMVTQRYTHSSDERKKAAVELLSKGKSVTQVVTQVEESKLIH